MYHLELSYKLVPTLTIADVPNLTGYPNVPKIEQSPIEGSVNLASVLPNKTRC